MRRILFLSLIALAWPSAHPQSSLPPCPTDPSVIWTNCYGAYTSPNGQKYVGEFRDGRRNGRGTIILPNGDRYDGQWKDDHLHGRGTYTFSDGRKYVGEFLRSVRQGRGFMVRSDGTIGESGIWNAGKLVQSFIVLSSRDVSDTPSSAEPAPAEDAQTNVELSAASAKRCLDKGQVEGTLQYFECIAND